MGIVTKRKGSGICGITDGIIDDTIDSYQPSRLDTSKAIDVSGDACDASWLEEVVKTYEGILEQERKPDEDFFVVSKGAVKQALTPEQINAFLQASVRYEDHKNYLPHTGIFVSGLMQRSYESDKNFNNFLLNTENLKKIHNIGILLKGTEKNPLKVEIQGNTGYNCGSYAKSSSFIVQGNTRHYCGLDAKNSSFVVQGNTEDYCGWCAKSSSFVVQGNTGYNCGLGAKSSSFIVQGNTEDYCGPYAIGSSFVVQGNTRNYCGRGAIGSSFVVHGNIGNRGGVYANNSSFKTSNNETLQKMLKDVSIGNKVVYINPNGAEEVRRDDTSKAIEGFE